MLHKVREGPRLPLVFCENHLWVVTGTALREPEAVGCSGTTRRVCYNTARSPAPHQPTPRSGGGLVVGICRTFPGALAGAHSGSPRGREEGAGLVNGAAGT